MATVMFYEKPGCINNTRQKQLLRQSGHEVIAKNLLEEEWDEGRLLLFFKGHPVAEWFNHSAPQVKSGEIDPKQISAKQALTLMLSNPLLIRRPLLQVGEHHQLGFDFKKVQGWIGLFSPDEEEALQQDLETCPRQHTAHSCANAN